MKQDWDAVISDYNLPGFSGLVALDLLKSSGRDIPFILVSGEIGEDTAVEAMRNGASDYLLKNNLTRLVPALMHAIEATETRHARARADRELDESKQRSARTRPAPADQHRAGTCVDRARDPRRRRWLAHGAQVRSGLDGRATPPTSR